jgi:ACS family glucarate transporter-like MFS transporter
MTQPVNAINAGECSTHTRYGVVAILVALAMVTYLDRACIGTLAPWISADLELSKEQMSLVFSAFALAYAAFEIPTASWADRRGTRLVLTRIVLWWSSFTMATAAAVGHWSLLMTRFLFGIGEAGAWPTAARSFSRWIPSRERGTVQGIFFAGAHLAGGLTPPLVLLLMNFLPWRSIFILFGSVGFLWAACWYAWFRDEPEQHPRVNAAELAQIVAGRQPPAGHSVGWAYWRRLFGNRNVQALCLMYFPNSFAFYFCLTWLPTYLKERHGFEAVALGVLAGLPAILSVAADLLGGVTTDWSVARFGPRLGRCGVGGVAYLLAGAGMLLAALSPHPILAAVSIAVATAASMFTLGAAWGVCLDIGGHHAGVVSAAMNTSGQIGSVLSPLIVSFCLKHWANWDLPLYLMGALFLVGALAWCFVNPRRPVFE